MLLPREKLNQRYGLYDIDCEIISIMYRGAKPQRQKYGKNFGKYRYVIEWQYEREYNDNVRLTATGIGSLRFYI